jgi:hypothetical protein
MPAVEAIPGRLRAISKEEWARALQPGTPALPWTGPQGQEVCSVMLVPVPECSEAATLVMMDIDGNTIDVRNDGPMYRTAEALGPRLGEVLLLPDPRSPR